MVSDAILCPLHNFKTMWNSIIILHCYVEQVIIICRALKRHLLFLYFLSYLPLMVKATMQSIMKTIRNIFMRLYGFVEEVVTMRHMAALEFIPPPPKKK